jgi:membrane-bound lytic murein transglycosylase D
MKAQTLFHALVLAFLMGTALRARALPIPLELFREAEPRVLRVQIQSETNVPIQKWIRFFAVDDRARFDRFMQRGSFYKTMIQDTLVENGVPPEMYYLAMIESGFARKARSSASAVGVWQFGRATARLYGLRVDQEVDERMDIIRSTRAAARLLKSLKQEFGSWYMAMAAYNCGSGCVRKAARRGYSKDFWTLARRGVLPAETVNYVPKFQAAMTIARDPERYGFERKALYEFPLVRRVRISGRVLIAEISRRHAVPIGTILALNPHLIRGQTPLTRKGYEIWLPKLRRSRSVASTI